MLLAHTGGAEVFVHLSTVREAGLADLRKGQKISFEIFDSQGKAAAKNLHIDRAMEDESDHNPGLASTGPGIMQCNMNQNRRTHKKAHVDRARRSGVGVGRERPGK